MKNRAVVFVKYISTGSVLGVQELSGWVNLGWVMCSRRLRLWHELMDRCTLRFSRCESPYA